MKKLRRKEYRAMKAKLNGERLNTSLIMALFGLPDKYVSVDASDGSDSMKVTITEAGKEAVRRYEEQSNG